MFKNIANFFRKLDSRIKVTIVGMGMYNWGRQFSFQYNQLYASVLGANAIQLGFLISIQYAVNALFSLPLGWFTENVGVKKVLLLGLACSAISSVFFSVAFNWWFLIPAFILGNVIHMYALADIVFINVSHSHQRNLIMSLSRVLWRLLSIFAPAFAAITITTFGGISVDGIRPLYYIQLLLCFVVLLLFLFKLSPIRVIRQFGISLALPFILLWMVNVKSATPLILGGFGTLSVAAALLFQFPAGLLADRWGRKRAYLLLRPITYLGMLILIFAPRPEYLFLVGLLGTTGVGGGIGGIGGVSFTPFITMNWELVPEEKRGRWLGLEGLINLSVIPASLLGGWLWDQGFLIEVLIFPIILELLLVMPLLATIPDTIHNS